MNVLRLKIPSFSDTGTQTLRLPVASQPQGEQRAGQQEAPAAS